MSRLGVDLALLQPVDLDGATRWHVRRPRPSTGAAAGAGAGGCVRRGEAAFKIAPSSEHEVLELASDGWKYLELCGCRGGTVVSVVAKVARALEPAELLPPLPSPPSSSA